MVIDKDSSSQKVVDRGFDRTHCGFSKWLHDTARIYWITYNHWQLVLVKNGWGHQDHQGYYLVVAFFCLLVEIVDIAVDCCLSWSTSRSCCFCLFCHWGDDCATLVCLFMDRQRCLYKSPAGWGCRWPDLENIIVLNDCDNYHKWK